MLREDGLRGQAAVRSISGLIAGPSPSVSPLRGRAARAPETPSLWGQSCPFCRAGASFVVAAGRLEAAYRKCMVHKGEGRTWSC